MEGQLEAYQYKEDNNGLTSELASKIFIQSFRHSQGNPELQKRIFAFIHLVHPQWQMDDTLRHQVEDKSTEMIRRILRPGEEPSHGHIPIGTSAITLNIKAELASMEYELKATQHVNADSLLIQIAELMIGQDAKYLSSGRPGREAPTSNSYPDAPFSYIGYYGIERHSTGLAELDQMYLAVAALLKNDEGIENLDPDVAKLLPKVISSYQISQLHPSVVSETEI